MKTIARSFLVALLASLSLAPAAWAGAFTSEVLVSTNASMSSQFPDVAAYSNTVHLVWVGYVSGQPNIYYARSTDSGASFSTPVNLSNISTGIVDRPQVTAGPNGVYVAWNSDNNTGAIYFVRSTDGGQTFGAPAILAGAEGGSYSRITQLFTDSAGRVHLALYDGNDTPGVGMIHHRMTCDGSTWGPEYAITSTAKDGAVDNEEPRLAESNGTLYLVFRSSRNGNPQGGWPPYSIIMQTGKISCPAGTVTWSYPGRRVGGGMPLTLGDSYRPEIFVESATGKAHVAWWNTNNGANVYYRNGTASTGALGPVSKISSFGVDHLEPGALSGGGGFQAPPGLVSNGSMVFLAYQQNAASTSGFENGPILLRESDDDGSTWGSEQQISSTNQATTPRIAIEGSGGQNVAIVWSDYRTGTVAQIYFRMYVNTITPTFSANVNTVITGYYNNILGRAPDSGGMAYWTGETTRVVSLGADVREVFFVMSMQFFNSTEYLSRNTSNNQYLTDLYNTFFSRPPDSTGLNYWLTQMQGGMTRGGVLANFLFSTEFSNTMTALFGTPVVRPEINMTIDLYRGILENLPDSAGFDYWLGRIRTAQCQGASSVNSQVTTISQLFIGSPQYVNMNRSTPDYLSDLYNAFMRRGPDLSGFNYWVGQVNSGAMSRDAVRAQFVASPEFQARVSAVISAGCYTGP